jgi:hypothetical protein
LGQVQKGARPTFSRFFERKQNGRPYRDQIAMLDPDTIEQALSIFDARARVDGEGRMSRIGGIRPMWSAGGFGSGGRFQGRRGRADPPAGWGKTYGTLE